MPKFVLNKSQALVVVTYFFGMPYHTVNGRRGKMKARDLTRDQVKFASEIAYAAIEACFRMSIVEDLYNASAGAHPDAIEIIVTVAEGYKGHVRTRERNRRNPLGTSVYQSIKNTIARSHRSEFEMLFGAGRAALSGGRTSRRGLH